MDVGVGRLVAAMKSTSSADDVGRFNEPEVRRAQAHHEAGHAVRALAWHHDVRRVSLDAHPDYGDRLVGVQCYVPVSLEALTVEQVLQYICVGNAGQVAEYQYHLLRSGREPTPEEWAVVWDGSRTDRENVGMFRRRLPADQHHLELEWICREVDDWFERPEVWRVVEAVARELEQRGALTSTQLEETAAALRAMKT